MEDYKEPEAFLIAEDKTDYYADSVEWCPFSYLSNYFVCGTYQLDEGSASKSQVRVGNLVLYKVEFEDSSSQLKLSRIESCFTSGILDLKWCSKLLSEKVVLAFVCSDGKLVLKHFEQNNLKLFDLAYCDLAKNDEKLILSVDWAWENESSAYLVASDTKGLINYFQVCDSSLQCLSSWKAHNFEAWISSFNHFNPNIIYSGADDCLFKCWDIRNLSSPVFVNKQHSMGVTAISKHKLNENTLVTGSYDEIIRLWDIRNMKSPLSELSVGGGVWRLKWHPTDPNLLISASMLSGFHIVSTKNNQLHMELSYSQHKSLAYGVDWYHAPSNFSRTVSGCETTKDTARCDLNNTVASCSFYDKLLCVWKINI